MATSESDGFESADDELTVRKAKAQVTNNQRTTRKCIGSDSDDDVDFIPAQAKHPMSTTTEFKDLSYQSRREIDRLNDNLNKMDTKKKSAKNKPEKVSDDSAESTEESRSAARTRERKQRPRKSRDAQSAGAKKLGATKVEKLPDAEKNLLSSPEAISPDEVRKTKVSEGKFTMSPPLRQECWEECDEKNLQEELKIEEMKESSKEEPSEPPELMSNFKFKDIFKPDGWEALGEDVELPNDFSDDKYHPVLDKLTTPDDNGGWGGWGSWGMSSLINTATAGVSTLTSHVTQGLTLLEESMGIPDPEELVEPSENPTEEKIKSEENESKEESKVDTEADNKEDESPSQYLPSFDFGNFISSMSSITKYVESTGSKVISGGLDTLETIGKKTMEVLQEGDPGLKKKRDFFFNEGNQPVLSQILREAKEKADVAEKSLEEKELARKVHFESLFDDYQGLVHLEALEMLSKQCIIKIQQQLVNLDGNDLTQMQEILDEVKELCDLGEDDEEEEDENKKNKDLKEKLEEACKDLGVTMTYDKLINSWTEINSQISLPSKTQRELFQNSISSLAQFTAYSVERFHKTAELLLIKPRRSTVNEADSLVQLTKTLSTEIGSIATLYIDSLSKFTDENEQSQVSSSIKTINLEATNASSYVQEAFRLLIPILQVGAI